MTITEELENIILKCKLDNAYPRFKNYVKCKKIVKKLFSEYTENSKILLLSSEQDSLSFALQEIEIVCHSENQIVDVLNFEKLNEIDFSSYSDIIIVSQEFYKEISYELSLMKIKHKCLYDYFVKNGIFIDYNYYNIFGGKYMPFIQKKDGTNYSFPIMNPSYELFYCYKKYISSQERELKQFYLQRIIFLSLYMRDFIAADKYINIYNNNKYENFKLYINALKSIEKLLSKIKLKLSVRKDDCFIFLNDALQYGNQKYTPFLNSISKNSLHFENAWTTTQYTKPSIKSLITGKFLIDDRSFEIPFKNSLVENLCKERNMQFRYLGLLDFEQNTNDNIGWTTPASRIYWLALEYLLSSNIKKFIFTHTLIETHSPFCANNLDKLKNIVFVAYSDNKQQMELSIAYLDKQLKWYSEFFPQNSIKIYMNDHGSNFPERLQARLNINAPWIKPKKVNGLFSYSDFHKLVNMLLNKNLNSLDSLFLNHTKNQELPIYGKLLNTLSNSDLPPLVFGYRAAIAKESIYIKYGDGSEYYRRHKISRHRFSMRELEYLRSVAGNNFLDYKKEEKLKLAKYVFVPLERYNKRNGIYEKKKNQIFLNLLKNFPKEKVIAIRSGGDAGFNLLLKLGVEQQQRISWIIDKNPKCKAAYLGIPVASPEKAKNLKLDIIITPQNQNNISQEVQKELLAFSKNGFVIDIYKYLAEKGIVCTRNFWEREFLLEDFYWE